MNLTIENLEKIGQNTSLKDHDNLLNMLNSFSIENNYFDNINLLKKELICGLVPEDDGESEDETKPE